MVIEKWNEIGIQYQKMEEVFNELMISKYKINLKEFYVLHYLFHTQKKCISISDLQYKIGLSQSATSRLVKRLEQKEIGLIDRHQCSLDKRTTYIEITEKGEKKYLEMQEVFKNQFQAQLKNFQMLIK